jgi:hypothetical protein
MIRKTALRVNEKLTTKGSLYVIRIIGNKMGNAVSIIAGRIYGEDVCRANF